MDRRGRVGRKVHLSWKEWSMRWVGFLGQRERARTAKSFPPKPDCYGRKRSALNSPQRGSSNIRPTHAGSGAILRGKVVVIIVVYIDELLVASETKLGEERLVASLTATPPSGVRSGAGTGSTPHRLQCGMLNLEESQLYRRNQTSSSAVLSWYVLSCTRISARTPLHSQRVVLSRLSF